MLVEFYDKALEEGRKLALHLACVLGGLCGVVEVGGSKWVVKWLCGIWRNGMVLVGG